MFKKIKDEYGYKFSTVNSGIFVVNIEASCQDGKFFGFFGGEDLRVEINRTKQREIPAKGRAQYFNIPPTWNGTTLKGLKKTVVFILNLNKGDHEIQLYPKNGAIITREPAIIQIKPGQAIIQNIQAENGDRRPWSTIALIDLPLKILDVSATCEKKSGDSDDLKLIIDGRIEKNQESNWWGKNWFWQGHQLQGYTKESRFYTNLEKGVHYIEFWADRTPVLNSVHLDLGIHFDSPEDSKDDTPLQNIPNVDNPKWTGSFNDDTEQMILARAIWGEARGTSEEARIAIAWSIKNRLGKRKSWDTYHNIILQPSQYSAFWETFPEDNNLKALRDPLGTTDNINDYKKWRKTYEIAGDVISQNIPDLTKGATHYYDDSIKAPFCANDFKIKIENLNFFDSK